MAAFNRPKKANYEVHENVTIDTQDNEDHTFCGIMFPIKCKDLLPIDHLVINSVSVRGRLGPLTVWVSNNEEDAAAAAAAAEGTLEHSTGSSSRRRNRGRRNNTNNDHEVLRVDRAPGSSRTTHSITLHKSAWTKLYDKNHPPSFRQYKELVLDKPIRLRPGETRVIYIHSTLPGDEAIVYDNSYYGTPAKRFEDDKLAILTGRAHVSTKVFGQEPIWGWGNAWRDRREFVGRLAYGTVYKLWNPEVHPKFGSSFQDGARALLLCQRRWESPWSMLPDECVYYILNMCRWDWFNDSSNSMKERRKRERARDKLALTQQDEQNHQQATVADDDMEDAKPSAASGGTCRPVTRSQTLVTDPSSGIEDDLDDDDDEEFDDNDDENDDEDEDEDEDLDRMDEDESEDGEDSDDWSDDDEDQYHTANRRQFTFDEVDSDAEEEDGNEEESVNARRDWIRRQFARIHVLRALASADDEAVSIMD